MKTTISALKERISSELTEGVNFWNHEYVYDPNRDSVSDLVSGAMKWFNFDRLHRKWTSPGDPRFVAAIKSRMKHFGISDHVINNVLLSLSEI